MTSLVSLRRRMDKLTNLSAPEPITEICWVIKESDPETGLEKVSKKIIWPVQSAKETKDDS